MAGRGDEDALRSRHATGDGAHVGVYVGMSEAPVITRGGTRTSPSRPSARFWGGRPPRMLVVTEEGKRPSGSRSFALAAVLRASVSYGSLIQYSSVAAGLPAKAGSRLRKLPPGAPKSGH
jgi:hypothetical protein